MIQLDDLMTQDPVSSPRPMPSRPLTDEEARAIGDPARLKALRATGLLDSPEEEAFDRLTRLASRLLGTPLALVNLVDDERQFSKSRVAPPAWPEGRHTDMVDSYCKWTVASGEPVAIEDARLDERVSGSGTANEQGLLSYLGIPLVTPGGHALGALCVAGFEPRTWTDDEIRLLQDLTASAVNEIASRLDARASREMERVKDELVSIVAHELRTPLTSIRGSLGLLASGKVDLESPQARRMLDIALQNSNRLVRLINDMLDLERMESGSAELSREGVPAAVLVEQALDAVRASASAAEVSLEVTLEPELVLYADPDRMAQVLINLLSNAIKFSPQGAAVRVMAERRGGEALFQVRDAGRGIPPEKLELIFERFKQADSSDARDKGGTGLGLAISRSIVRQHGGRVWAASEVGRGSTFFFTVALAPG